MALSARLLHLEGELVPRETLAKAVRRLGGTLQSIRSGSEVMGLLEEGRRRREPYGLLVLDLSNQSLRAPVLLRMIEQRFGSLPSFIIGDEGSWNELELCLESGASDFDIAPVKLRELALRLSAFLGTDSKRAVPVSRSKRKPRKSDLIIGGDEWIKELYERISMVAPTDVTVAISGESGTGKELVARTIHRLSNRFEEPFVVVNCAAIPESLLEDELFGHVRGAFTDANRDRAGLVAAADKGTLFLDEIGEMSLPLQAKLLRVLQTQEFRPIGSDVDHKVDIRLVTATNKRLEELVSTGLFREDLYYRIQVFPMELLPLRERRGDIPLLAQHFLLMHRDKVGKKVEGFTPEALQKLQSFDYPGNVRELENKIHHALVLSRGDAIEAVDIPESARRSVAASGELDLRRGFKSLKKEAVGAFEKRFITELLEAHGGNLAAASRQAKVDRKNLWSLCKKYGIDIDAVRARKRAE